MITIVAPYSPAGSGTPNLGASRKLEIIIALLASIDADIFLINSAHNSKSKNNFQFKNVIINGCQVTEILLPTLRNRAAGKLFNLRHVSEAIKILSTYGKPNVIWLYNAYAFEMLFARAAKAVFSCPIVLEFEDWHFARSRGLSVKPHIDWLLWRRATKAITYGYGVNAFLVKSLSDSGIPAALLPGIVPAQLIDISVTTPPFPPDRKFIKIGYFGGLSEEKGVDLLISAIDKTPDYCRYVISGTGPLQSEILRLAEQHRERVTYIGLVPESELYRNIADCDVIVNPHMSLHQSYAGVFPFKVLEAVASGRLLISTALPTSGLEDVLDGVYFFDGTSDGLASAVAESKGHYEKERERVENASRSAHQRFSGAALLQDLTALRQGVLPAFQ